MDEGKGDRGKGFPFAAFRSREKFRLTFFPFAAAGGWLVASTPDWTPPQRHLKKISAGVGREAMCRTCGPPGRKFVIDMIFTSHGSGGEKKKERKTRTRLNDFLGWVGLDPRHLLSYILKLTYNPSLSFFTSPRNSPLNDVDSH